MLDKLKELWQRWKVQVTVVGGVLVVATAYGTCSFEPPTQDQPEEEATEEAVEAASESSSESSEMTEAVEMTEAAETTEGSEAESEPTESAE